MGELPFLATDNRHSLYLSSWSFTQIICHHRGTLIRDFGNGVVEAPGAYPLLQGRPWLRLANIKRNGQHNCLSFRRGRAKIRVPMQESAPAPKEISLLEGLEDEELEC